MLAMSGSASAPEQTSYQADGELLSNGKRNPDFAPLNPGYSPEARDCRRVEHFRL
jgi:hypothetical protein